MVGEDRGWAEQTGRSAASLAQNPEPRSTSVLERSRRYGESKSHPFDFAQGRLCRRLRDKGTPSSNFLPENFLTWQRSFVVRLRL